MRKTLIRGMILAAGLGTRLKPFTDHHPKALYIVEGITLLEHAIRQFKAAEINELIINVHHFAGQITDFLRQNDNFGLEITISDETNELLETGGGVKKAGWYLDQADCVVVRNVDIASDLDLQQLATRHMDSGALATLSVRDRLTSRYLLFNDMMTLCGWENTKSAERVVIRQADALSRYAFSGIQALSPGFFPLITETGSFSLTHLYLRLAENQRITGLVEEGRVWKDLGKSQS